MHEKPMIIATKNRYISYQVMYVFRANFNDTYYLEDYKFNVDEIPTDRLIWIDPFYGISKINNKLVAIKSISDDEMVILEKTNDKIIEHKTKISVDVILCEDYDSSMLLACHIKLTT